MPGSLITYNAESTPAKVPVRGCTYTSGRPIEYLPAPGLPATGTSRPPGCGLDMSRLVGYTWKLLSLDDLDAQGTGRSLTLECRATPTFVGTPREGHPFSLIGRIKYG